MRPIAEPLRRAVDGAEFERRRRLLGAGRSAPSARSSSPCPSSSAPGMSSPTTPPSAARGIASNTIGIRNPSGAAWTSALPPRDAAHADAKPSAPAPPPRPPARRPRTSPRRRLDRRPAGRTTTATSPRPWIDPDRRCGATVAGRPPGRDHRERRPTRDRRAVASRRRNAPRRARATSSAIAGGRTIAGMTPREATGDRRQSSGGVAPTLAHRDRDRRPP